MILTLDVETWASCSFAFGVIYNPQQDTYEIFYKSNDMRKYLLSLVNKNRKSEKIYIYGHNISYDLNWIFDNYEMFFKNEFTIDSNKKRYWKKIIAREGKLYEAKYYNLHFLDTMNLFPMSLKVAGDVVNYKKDIDKRKKFENNKNPQPITEIDIQYCLDDCKITYMILKNIEKWVKSHGGKMKRTVASTGFSILQNYNPIFKKWLKDMNKSQDLTVLDESFRKSYFGGRTETHLKEGNNLKYYDINSLYPFTMSNEKFKYPNPSSLFKFNGKIQYALDNYEGNALIKVKSPSNIKIPVLPIRAFGLEKVNEGKIIYPKGIFWGTWNFPEIRLALEMGYEIIEAENIVCGKKLQSPFKKYIDIMYAERLLKKQNNDKTEIVSKLYMNGGAYGKLVQRDYENRIISIQEADEMQKIIDNSIMLKLERGYITEKQAEILRLKNIYEVIYYKNQPFVKYKTDSQRSRNDLMCLGSYVTTHSRCTIYDWYRICNYLIYYSDTDSLVTPKELPTGINLGEMKLEANILYGSFKGRKDYWLKFIDEKDNKVKGMTKRKGCSLKMVSEMFYRDEWVKVNPRMKQLFIDKNANITKIYHYADLLKIERILKSREALIRDLNAGELYEGEKQRKMMVDNGRLWDNDISIPYNILQDNLTDIPIIV